MKLSVEDLVKIAGRFGVVASQPIEIVGPYSYFAVWFFGAIGWIQVALGKRNLASEVCGPFDYSRMSVTLNGQPVEDCCAFDTRRNYVVHYIRDPWDGQARMDQFGGIPKVTRYGIVKVEIEPERKNKGGMVEARGVAA